jgi:hypothetical protein
MTEPKLKADKEAGNLSETTKSYLVDHYVKEKYGRENDITSKYLTKGLMVEEDSITLYSRVKKTFFSKNEERLSNEYITGVPDLYTGANILDTEVIIDLKSSWDIFTFFRTQTKEVNSDYYYQLQGYMCLTGARVAKLAYCLINTPEMLITDEKRKLLYKMNVTTDENPEFLEACDKIDKAMTYDDLPLNKKVIEFTIPRDEAAIDKIKTKVLKAREYLNQLDREL